MRFPLFIDLEQKKAVVFGCGEIGRRRIRALCAYGAQVTVIAPHIPQDIRSLAFQAEEKRAERADISGAFLVCTCTNDRAVNHEIYAWCHEAGILVNCSDKKEECDFYFPALAEGDGIVAGICGDGSNHKRTKEAARAVRDLLQTQFGTKRKIVAGSRDSKLAVIQTELVLDAIRDTHPELEVSLTTMKTTGDMILDRPLDLVGGKGLFVKELDRKLAEGAIDISVHSLKDMPMEQPEGMPICAVYKREDPGDVLVFPEKYAVCAMHPEKAGTEEEKAYVKKLESGKICIGTSSKRRAYQLKRLFPQAEFRSVRGNVFTRLAKLDDGQYDALVLAAAGLRRLGLEGRIGRTFGPDEVIPAAGQGVLAVQGREKDDLSFLESIHDEKTWLAVSAERAFAKKLDGGCSSPTAAFAAFEGETLMLRGLYEVPQTGELRRGSLSELVNDKETAEALGIRLAKLLAEDRG